MNNKKFHLDQDILDVTYDALVHLRNYYSGEKINTTYQPKERNFFNMEYRRCEKALMEWRRLKYILKDVPSGVLLDFDDKIYRED